MWQFNSDLATLESSSDIWWVGFGKGKKSGAFPKREGHRARLERVYVTAPDLPLPSSTRAPVLKSPGRTCFSLGGPPPGREQFRLGDLSIIREDPQGEISKVNTCHALWFSLVALSGDKLKCVAHYCTWGDPEVSEDLISFFFLRSLPFNWKLAGR